MYTLDDLYGYQLDSNKEFKPYLKAIRNTIRSWDMANKITFDANISHREMSQLLLLCLKKINQMMTLESRPNHHTGYDPDSSMNLYDPDIRTNSYAKLKRIYKYNATHTPEGKCSAYCDKYNLVKQPLAMMKLALRRSKDNYPINDHGSEIMNYCNQFTPKNVFASCIVMPAY